MARAKTRTRRRERKSVPKGRAYIQSTFNNTLITLTDPEGNVIASGSGGTMGFKGARKGTAFAAQRAAETTARKGMDNGLRQVDDQYKRRHPHPPQRLPPTQKKESVKATGLQEELWQEIRGPHVGSADGSGRSCSSKGNAASPLCAL